jgi:uncharacterized damage-inducible protein DinB
MSIGHDFLREFDEEMANTRKALERVPTEKGRWKPHPKSFSFGHLAQLVSWMPGWISETLRRPFLDLARPGGGYTYETTESLLKGFDANVAAARDALQTTSDAAWGETWHLKRGDRVFWSAPRTVVVRTNLNHLIHHRAQLGVYPRLNDIPVPPAYGPTADESPF